MLNKLKSVPAIRRAGSAVKQTLLDASAIPTYLAQRGMAKSAQPIRVGFLCQFIPAWSKLKPVYELMCADPRFQPLLICVPSNIQDSVLVGNAAGNDTYDYFTAQGYDAVNALKADGAWLELENLRLDYIFYPRPYNAFLPEAYHSKKVSRFCRILLVLYGMSMTEEVGDTVMDRDFFRYVYLYFAESPFAVEKNRKKGWLLHTLGLQKSVFKGLPGMEEIAERREDVSPAWDFSQNAFRVLWTPRWTTDPSLGGTNFFTYYRVLLRYAGEHPQVDFLFRPHPLALSNFVSNGDMTAGEAEAFRSRVQAMPNVSLDAQKEYFSTMWGASVMISDISGIMPEFFVTGKPLIYCASNMPLTPAAHTRKMLEGCYVVQNEQELLRCLEALQAGDDPLAAVRHRIIGELYGGLDSTPSREILEEIAKDRDLI